MTDRVTQLLESLRADVRSGTRKSRRSRRDLAGALASDGILKKPEGLDRHEFPRAAGRPLRSGYSEPRQPDIWRDDLSRAAKDLGGEAAPARGEMSPSDAAMAAFDSARKMGGAQATAREALEGFPADRPRMDMSGHDARNGWQDHGHSGGGKRKSGLIGKIVKILFHSR